MTLESFIRGELDRPFAWGETDCASTADRWVRELHGFSPMARYGRRYSDESGGRAWLAEFGLARAIRSVMAACGFAPTRAPHKGDVGLIVYRGRLCVAIHVGIAAFSRDEHGPIGGTVAGFRIAWKVAT